MKAEKNLSVVKSGVSSVFVANLFDVSPKTIRDIWNHRTWQKETRHLWSENNPLNNMQGGIRGWLLSRDECNNIVIITLATS
jgi:hypothetical protein